MGFGDSFFGFGGAFGAPGGLVPVGDGGGLAVGSSFLQDHVRGVVAVGVAVVDLGINEGERDLGHAGGLAVAGAGKDDVFHLDTAEAFCALLAEDPGDGVGDVGFAAAVGADDGGDAGAGELDLGAVTEGLEAEDLDLLELEHGDLDGDRARCERRTQPARRRGMG